MKPRVLSLFFLFLVSIQAHAALNFTAETIGNNESSPYVYIRITVTNPTDHKLEYNMTIKENVSKRNIVIRERLIEAGVTRIHNLALLLESPPFVEFKDSDGGRSALGLHWKEKEYLNICELENWASEKSLRDFSQKLKGVGGSNIITQMEPENLPDNWLCYSPLKAVFITESSYNRLESSAREALLNWVRSGGWLTIYDTNREELSRLMMGTIQYQSQSPLLKQSHVFPYLKIPWQWFYKSRSSRKYFPYTIKERSGKIGGFLLATLFLVAAGPLNYAYFRKRKRIRMLLVSLPVISLGFCLLMIGYFFTTKGFSQKGGTYSVTILDEAEDAAFTFSRHLLYSGLYPRGGFKFNPDTAFYPITGSPGFTMELTNRQHLKSGLFMPSQSFHYFTAWPFKTREKLVFDSSEKAVTNGFENAIQGLIIRQDGTLYQAEDISPGEKKKLTPIKQRNLKAAFSNFFLDSKEKNYWSRGFDVLTTPLFKREAVRYILRFRDPPSSIETGTAVKSKRNCYILIGI